MAGRNCSICQHDQRSEIDNRLVRREPYRDISRHYGVSKDALSRHAKVHLSETLRRAENARIGEEADDLLLNTRKLQMECLRILAESRKEGLWDFQLKAIREAGRLITLRVNMRRDEELEKRIEELEGKVRS